MEVDDENKQSSLDELIKPSNLIYSQEPIMLNVGGVKYQTSLSTLTCHSGSFFAKMFGGKFSVQPCSDGSYFIDRDGKNFEHILDFLRTKKIFIKNDECLIERLLSESEYYNLPSLRSLILLKASGSRILNEADIEFIHKCHIDQFGRAPIISKNAIISCGPKYPALEILSGLRRLLFLFETQDTRSRFALYLDDEYGLRANGYEFDCGYVLELERNMEKVGEHRQHKKMESFNCYVDKPNALNWYVDADEKITRIDVLVYGLCKIHIKWKSGRTLAHLFIRKRYIVLRYTSFEK